MKLWRPRSATLLGVLVIMLLSVGLLGADTGANHQLRETRPIQLGTSGGNINDRSRTFCCSGTLGALVTKNGVQYILSNNHVLARTNAGKAGDDIIQPGLIDETPTCALKTADAVADLSEWLPITFSKTNIVDGAIAAVRSGQVDPTGAILDLGVVSSVPAPAVINMAVQKSGRTTGLTSGVVAAVNVTINVKYGSQCGGGRGTATFVNQIRVTPGSFSTGGDSGSLVVSTTTLQPVALLFAGSSTDTFANPIQNVLDSFGVTIVGTTTSSGGGRPLLRRWLARILPSVAPAQATSLQHPIHPASQAAAMHAKERHEAQVMAIPGVIGVGVGASETVAGEAVIEIYVEKDTPELRRSVPARLDNVPVKIVETGEIRARSSRR